MLHPYMIALEGKSIVDLSEEKKFIPPLLEKIISAKPIEFTAETRLRVL